MGHLTHAGAVGAKNGAKNNERRGSARASGRVFNVRPMGIRHVALGAGLLAAVGCGGSNTAPSQPPSLNLAGTWSGTLRQPGSQGGSTITVIWVVTQVGNRVSGPETVSEPRRGTTYSGTLAGTLTGTQLSLTETVPQGSIPGFPLCSISGAGSFSASAASISGTITARFASCEGFNFFANPESVIEEFVLTK